MYEKQEKPPVNWKRAAAVVGGVALLGIATSDSVGFDMPWHDDGSDLSHEARVEQIIRSDAARAGGSFDRAWEDALENAENVTVGDEGTVVVTGGDNSVTVDTIDIDTGDAAFDAEMEALGERMRLLSDEYDALEGSTDPADIARRDALRAELRETGSEFPRRILSEIGDRIGEAIENAE
ncbi:MAG: hypothetical protein V2J26_07120 [Pacificimonas sp.]|jgi:hypothetical protein|nr:hypothetical protein [Pacificimonas sp.]